MAEVYSTGSSRSIVPEKRKCLFYNERDLDFYANYSRSNCQMECSLKYTRLKCGCQPYFYPCKNSFNSMQIQRIQKHSINR